MEIYPRPLVSFSMSDKLTSKKATKPLRYALKVISQTRRQQLQTTENNIEASRYLDTAVQFEQKSIFYFLYQYFASNNLLSDAEREKYSKHL